MIFELTILGSSSAVPTSKRNLSAYILNVYERFFLIDCGEGTQIQLRRNKIKFGKINHIFISHLHGDHVFGLFGLISTFNLLNRRSDLHIYAHGDLERILQNHISYFERNLSFKLIFHHLRASKNEIIYEDSKVMVETIPLKHRIPACGFKFTEKPLLLNIRKECIEKYSIPVRLINNIKKGEDFITDKGEVIPSSELTFPPCKQRAFAYCSDTALSEKIIPVIEGVDLLFHEATFAKNMQDQAKKTLHSTAHDAATIAKKGNVSKLVIGHFSTRYKDLNKLLDEARNIFPNTHLANDGDKHKIEIKRQD